MPAFSRRRELFEKCVVEHADSLYRVAFRLVGNRDQAEELVQETCLNAWNNIDSLRDETKIRSWIFSILRNQYRKILRNQPPKALDIAVNEPLAKTDDPTLDFDQQKLQTAIEKLDENFRLPLLLVVMEGCSVQETAAILQLPKGTVLSRLYRARQKMKCFLNDEKKMTNGH